MWSYLFSKFIMSTDAILNKSEPNVILTAHATKVNRTEPNWTEPQLRNDLYCVEWGVKLYSLTHSRVWPVKITL